jgi:CRP/FNR family transcriptional regulator
MEELAYTKVGDRIVHLFTKLAAEHGVPAEGGIRIDLRLTHSEIASLVGSTRETVSAELAKLAECGRLVIRGRTVVVPTEKT